MNNSKTARLIDKAKAPNISVDIETFRQGMYLVKKHTTEVAWMSRTEVTKDDKDEVTVKVFGDIFVPEQKVADATVEVDDWGSLLNEIEESGIDLATVRAWHHSHNSMAVTPSGQDLDHAKEFYQEWGYSGGYFLSIIMNNRSQMRIDVYDWSAGIAFDDVTYNLDFPLSLEQEARLDTLCAERVKPLYQNNYYNRGVYSRGNAVNGYLWVNKYDKVDNKMKWGYWEGDVYLGTTPPVKKKTQAAEKGKTKKDLATTGGTSSAGFKWKEEESDYSWEELSDLGFEYDVTTHKWYPPSYPTRN